MQCVLDAGCAEKSVNCAEKGVICAAWLGCWACRVQGLGLWLEG